GGTDYRTELGPDLRQDQGHGHRYWRDDEPRGHRVPRIRPAGRDRDRQRLDHHQDRRPADRGWHQGHRGNRQRRTHRHRTRRPFPRHRLTNDRYFERTTRGSYTQHLRPDNQWS